MRKSSDSASPSLRSRSKKPHLPSSEAQSPDPVHLSSKTPEKTLHRRTRNRGVAFSIADIRKAAEGLQDRKQPNDAASSRVKTARRQIVMPSPSKTKNTDDEAFELPERYEILAEFFDSLDSAIRLMRLKRSTPSFTSISSKIECLTDRRFTHGHLAQLKFILPEAIVIKKFLVFDERTSCMKPDLHVTLDPDAVELDAKLLKLGGSLALRKLFRTRLRDFCKSHPEGSEIPEDTLPEPFNHLQKKTFPFSSLPAESSSDVFAADPPATMSSSMDKNDTDSHAVPVKTSVELTDQHVAVASHIPRSFRMSFSKKAKEIGVDNVQQKSSLELQSLPLLVSESSLEKNTSIKDSETDLKAFSSESDNNERCPTIFPSLESSSAPLSTPSKPIEYENKDVSLKSMETMSTPAKLVSTPSRLMTATPALPPPKRHYMSPDDNSASSLNKLARRPPRSRSLKFDTPVKNKEIVNEDDAGGLPFDEILEVLPQNLIQSIMEKERKAMEERDPAISEAKRRKKVIASLPKLFNMIHLLFRKRSAITKEELVSKIVSSHSDIVDRSEVEEQLDLLLELVPEWISVKLAISGDFLFCINKLSNPEMVRASLEEAK